MRRFHRRALAALLLLAGALLAPAQGPAPKGGDGKGEKKAPTPLPPGAVVAVYESVADALAQMPGAVLLSPGKFREMMEETERLRKLLERPVARAPSKCSLKGRVDGRVATFTLTYELATEKAGETVYLGCALAQATEASLDGRTPRLTSGAARPRAAARPEEGADGLFVEVERPGTHTLVLEVVLATASKQPGSQSLALDLPRAAITRLDLDLPGGAREVQLGGKPVADTLLSRKGNTLSGSLGPAEKLELSWRPARSGPAAPVLAADGTVTVRVSRAACKTEAHLHLRALAGSVRRWRVLVPRGATLAAAEDHRPRVARVEEARQGAHTLYTLHLKADSAEALAVHVTATSPGAGQPAAVGPFTVLGASSHRGSVLVSNAEADWHLAFTPRGDLTRRAITAEEQRRDADLVAAFRYGPAGAAGAWLDVEPESVRGQVKVRFAHALSLTAGPSWQVQTALTVSPHWADLDRLRVELPPGCTFNEEGSYPLPERVRGLSYAEKTRTVEMRLNRATGESALQPFTVRVAGAYAAKVERGVAGSARLGLPRAPGTIEEGGTLTVTAPASVALVPPEAAPPGLEAARQSLHELSYRAARRFPDRIDLAWRPYQPPVRVDSVVDLTLGPGEAHFRHELRYQLPAGATPRLALRVPAAVGASLRAVRGAKLVEGLAAATEERTVELAGFDVRRPAVLLEYTAPLPAARAGEPALFPLVVPEKVSEGEVRVRVWADAGGLPAPVGGGGWAEQSIEEVPGNDRLPALVLRADRADRPLRLRLGATDAPAVLVERALVRVDVAANGVQTYRASYRLARLAGRWLDLELPAPATSINLQLTLGGKRLDYERLAAEDPELMGRLVRLRLAPGLVAGPTLLDVTYQLTPDRMRSTALNTTLQGPRVLGEPGAAPTRWLITTPPGWVLLTPEAGPGTPRAWGQLGWLLAPRIALSAADLEGWLAGGEPGGPLEGAGRVTPSLLLWRDAGDVVRLTHAPRQPWLLGCSLALVLVMLMLGRLAKSGTDRGTAAAWVLGTGLVLATLAAVLLWPGLAGQVAYACQPGAAVLLLVGLFQWLVHERTRRQLVFLPNVARPHPGSSQMRPDPPRPHGEPPTVDVPRTAGSSVERA